MPSSNPHTTPIAKKTSLMIRGAKPGRRRAFALATYGNFVVMLAQRGKPATAVSQLRKMDPPKEAPEGDQKLPFRLISSGLLYREREELVIQCKQRVSIAQLAKARKYFKVLKATRPWNKVRITRLSDDDEGDQEPEIDATLEAGAESGQTDSDIDVADDDRDDEVADDWDGGEAAPPADAAPEPAESPEPPAAEPDDRQAAAQEMVEAFVVTDNLLKIGPMLKLFGSEANTRESLAKSVHVLLETLSPERLMLMLCYSSNIDALRENKDRLAEGYDEAQRGRPRVGKDPVKNDDAGRAEISDALAAYGQRIAQERGVLAPGETVRPDAHMDEMVAQAWQRDPDASFDKVLTQLLTMFSMTFEKAPAKRVRDMLGLPAEKPAADWDGFAKAVADWNDAESDAITNVQVVANAILDDYKDEPDTEAVVDQAISRLAEFSAYLEGAFKHALDQLLGESDAAGREKLRGPAFTAVGKMQAFLETDDVAANLDGNEFVPNIAIVAPLLPPLAAMQAALGQPALEQAA